MLIRVKLSVFRCGVESLSLCAQAHILAFLSFLRAVLSQDPCHSRDLVFLFHDVLICPLK